MAECHSKYDGTYIFRRALSRPSILITLPDFPPPPARRRRFQSRCDRPAAILLAAWRRGGRARRGSSQGQMA